MDRFKVPDIYPGNSRACDRPMSEVLSVHCHHCILGAGIMVFSDVLYIHHGRAADHDVVYHAGTTPASPPWTMNETGWTPPGNTWFPPSECYPANQRTPDIYT
jgi:hypothetical protein